MESFLNKSKKILLNFLKEPWAFSFFPSSFFWKRDFIDLEKKYIDFFSSDLYLKKDKNTKNNLYIHIPFCSKICNYCNCFKYKVNSRIEIKKYLSYLEKESEILFKLNSYRKINIDWIFIWWWTPNILNLDDFEFLYKIINKYFFIDKIEDFILDWHPNYYNKKKLDLFKNLWVTRITFAIQTFDKNILIKNNRDFYDIDLVIENLSYAKKLGIKVNIDLLIWLNWQTIDSFLNDMSILNNLQYDNLSIHYFMNSNNISYKIASNYNDLIIFVKKYFKENKFFSNSSNKFEDNFASTKNTTLSLWASSITNIYSKIVYSKPNIGDYYIFLDNLNLPYYKWFSLSKRDEMIKFIYLNILYWINISHFLNLYEVDIFKEFYNEFKFLNSNDIIFIDNNIIYSKKNDLETLIYFNIFFIEKFSFFDLNNYNKSELDTFFLSNWELIDK